MNNSRQAVTEQSILLVEDEPGLQEALALVLELDGFAVTRASDGEEAVARLQITQPDLIITDYMMPRMTGTELIKHVRRNPETAGIPILLVSAALPSHVDTTGADGFLPKPMSMKQLLGVVHRLLQADVKASSPSEES